MIVGPRPTAAAPAEPAPPPVRASGVSVEPSRPALSQTRTGSRTPRAASRARSRCALYEALRRTRRRAGVDRPGRMLKHIGISDNPSSRVRGSVSGGRSKSRPQLAPTMLKHSIIKLIMPDSPTPHSCGPEAVFRMKHMTKSGQFSVPIEVPSFPPPIGVVHVTKEVVVQKSTYHQF